uniref:Cobalamin synthesis protein, putative n=1 Tax=Theileria annulata TaxID=5874 RepID=A0A3B0N7A7_THEAN
MDKIPVTIITGFLGTGKTTLIRRICSELSHKRVGVIQNEFSDFMGIEKPILMKTGATVYELPNGCLCCSAKSDLVSALDAFLQLSDRIDWIIIESSGTSDPITLTGNLWLDDNLESKLKLDGVVSITDVNTLNLFLSYKSPPSKENPSLNDESPKGKGEYSELFETFSKQLSVGDLIVVNKTDINPMSDELRKYLKSVNSSNVVECVRCDFDLNLLFELGTFETKKLLSSHVNSERISIHVQTKLTSICIKSSKVYSLKYINDTISSLLWEKDDVYRCKGIFTAINDCSLISKDDGTVATFELQGIGKLYEINPVEVNISENIFLFIGNQLDRPFLNELFL